MFVCSVNFKLPSPSANAATSPGVRGFKVRLPITQKNKAGYPATHKQKNQPFFTIYLTQKFFTYFFQKVNGQPTDACPCNKKRSIYSQNLWPYLKAPFRKGGWLEEPGGSLAWVLYRRMQKK